jgi:hypothetical protein
MKGILFLFILSAITLSLIGCQTVPRQLVREEVVIIYYEPVYIDLPYIPEPPTPGPPTTHVTNPRIDNPPPRNLQSDDPKNGGSYGNRDRLQGGNNREPSEIKTYPPVRKPKQNDRVQ